MTRIIVVFVFITTVILPLLFCSPVEIADDDAMEIPVKSTERPRKGFSILKPADDAIFNFINKLVNTSYLSSKIMVNRIKAQEEIRKQIEDQVEEFLENLPTIPIPILDDMISKSKDTVQSE